MFQLHVTVTSAPLGHGPLPDTQDVSRASSEGMRGGARAFGLRT